MVLFDNINVNQEVEVRWHGDVRKGKVRYKGQINGYKGDWVGVELYANGTTYTFWIDIISISGTRCHRCQ